MNIHVTDEAVEILQRSLQLAGMDPAAGGIRLRSSHGLGGGMDVQVEFADGPLEGESVVETSGLRLFVDPQVIGAVADPVVAVAPQHGTLVVRPADPA